MQQIVIFSLLIGSVFAAPQHLLAAPVVAAAPALTAVHHPAVINTHLAPAAAVVQTPTLSGYSFTSEVRHAAPLIAAAAPIVAPAPVVAAAPVVHAAAPVVHAAAPLLSKTYSVETGHIVAGTSVAYAPGYATVAHAPLIAGTAVAHAPLVAPALAAPVVHAAAPVVAAPLFAHLKAKA